MLLRVNANYPVHLGKNKVPYVEEKPLKRNWPRVEMAQESSEEVHTEMRIMRKLFSLNPGPDGRKSEHGALICITSCALSHRKGLFQHPRKATEFKPSFL